MTRVMPKGSNTPLSAVDAVRAVLRWRVAPGGPDIDVVALLLGTDGRVRSDEDFVFYNQPRHPSGRVRHRSKTRRGEDLTDILDIDLAQLPAEVERVVVGGAAEGGNFAQVTGLCIQLYDIARGPDAEPLARFDIADANQVTAMLCGEIYRRSGGWKFRAIGQGYASGLVGLATDFGVTVDEDEEEAGASAPVTVPAQQSVPDGTAPDQGYGYPQLLSAPPMPETAPEVPPQAPLTAPEVPPQAPLTAPEMPTQPAPFPMPPLLPEPEGFALPPQGPQFLSVG
ncbi:TerD family protein [Streptacidiphilus albus]|uniref:TerD family protein n=1 Tax=Streptacidiphilus albus TaxID=105425 RepID=UPI00054BE433|nr:TerD family protein [Streptacidiphilus albus]